MSSTYTIIIETPKGAFIKRNERGGIDLISPFPCPFNYGHVQGHMGCDGDPLDAIVLGDRLPYNSRKQLPVVGRVLFIDEGKEDHKYIFADREVTFKEEEKLKKFFRFYAQIKSIQGLLLFRGCPALFSGLEWGSMDLSQYMG